MRNDREKWGKLRIRAVGFFFALFFAVVAGRSFYLQVIKEDELVRIAERQHQRTVPLTPVRGTIYDCTGAPLAVSVEMDSCYAEPRTIENIHETASKLAPVLGMPVSELEAKLTGNRSFAWLQRRILPETAAKVKELDLDGIGLVKEPKRFYPNSEVASHVIGFTGLDPEGLEGIELRYDPMILGNTGYLITERDALGREIARKGTVVKNASKGHNVTLTLDKNIQYITEKELAKAVTSSGARSGIAIVMEPQTGKVLAMANYPGFNPNTFSKFSPFALRNHAIADSFEPGSTFKAFLVAAALEEKAVAPGDGFNCENGAFSLGGITIHDTHRYGYLSVSDILKYSSNIGAAKIGRRLGQDRLARYLRAFGIGDRTGIDLPGESPGNLRDRNRWFDADLATVSFGQGVSSSAIQLAAGFSVIANGGTLMKPYLVEKVTDENANVVQTFAPQARHRVVSEDTARKVTRMMETVTREGGTGTNAAVEGYAVAGKTGTAQKVDPVTHRYSANKRTASFIGFVPADKPRLTILVVVDEPKTSPYGGIVAAPAFGAIAQQSLCYLHVPPEAGKGPKPLTVKAPAPVTEVAEAAAEGSIDYAGEGTQMPEFRGMSMRQVLRAMEKRGLNVRLIGSGRAIEQSPASGHRITPDDQVWVRFAPAA
jgi:cell division protein FtsI (penicillin-binding protein 3)